VRIPPEQRCCGALHEHNGDREEARELARRNIAVLGAAGDDAIVVNAAGCGAHLKSYGSLLRDDPAWADRAETFAGTIKDAAEYLAEAGLTIAPGRLDLNVAYQDPCHLLHGQRIRSQPRTLLRAIPGLHTVPVAEPELCCGSAGTYNITHADIAGQLRSRKVANVIRTGASVLVTTNPGCQLQLEAGLRASGAHVEVVHLMDLLDAAYESLERSPPQP
jgi:glycolate oxidase iron-sulfur subunit